MRRKLRLGLLGGALFSACCLPAAGAPTQPASSWTTFGASTARLGQAPGSVSVAQLSRRFVLPLSGQMTAQVLESAGTFVAASTGGDIVAFDRDGFVRWRTNVGQLALSCPQLNGYGVVGTGVIDPSSRTLYVADAFGRLHALSLATGDERRGWPIRVFSDLGRELDWGALTLADGSVYVPTAAFCDADGTPGGIYRVDLATKAVSHWLAVPLDEGGGGGPWGWGGLAYDSTSGSLFAGSSGAFQGGTNSGTSYTETAGFGDRLLEFGPGLQVRSSSHPAGLPDRMDLDFVGSPLLVPGTSCGPMVVAATKNDTVYGWSEGNLARGWTWKVAVEPYAVNDPFVAQLAWSAATSSVYAVTGTELVRIKVGAGCKASVEWRRPLGTHTENGSPTVAGNTVWLADNGTQALRRLRRHHREASPRSAARWHDPRGADRDRRSRRRRIVQRDRRGIRRRSHVTPLLRPGACVVDQFGRRRARLAEQGQRRLCDGRRRQALAADLSATRSRRAPRLRDAGSHLARVRAGRLHVRDPAIVDGRRRTHVARHEDTQR